MGHLYKISLQIFILNFLFNFGIIGADAPDGCEKKVAQVGKKTSVKWTPEQIAEARKKNGRQFKFVPVEKLVGLRGWGGRSPEFSVDSLIAAGEKLYFTWNQKIFFEETIKAALAHNESIPSKLARGSYVLGPTPKLNFDLEDPNQLNAANKEWRESFKKNISNGMVVFGADKIKFEEDEKKHPGGERLEIIDLKFGVDTPVVMKNKTGMYLKQGDWLYPFEVVDPQFISENVEVDTTVVVKNKTGTYLKQDGWFYPSTRGVLHTWETVNSTTLDKIKDHAWSRLVEGYRFTFNQDIDGCLELLRKQLRRKQSSTQNRYTDEYINLTKELFKRGHVITVEVWSPEGVLLGGILSLRFGNVINPDTVFGDIDSTKEGAALLMERLHAAGIFFVDTQMVSELSGRLGAVMVPVSEFNSLVSRLPKQRKDDHQPTFQFFNELPPPAPGGIIPMKGFVKIDYSPIQLDPDILRKAQELAKEKGTSVKVGSEYRPAEFKKRTLSNEAEMFKIIVDSKL
ncbi:MAG: leucyl/phenylalanyl-tRNA--protein transferase [Bacteriovoracaceae bacterium]|nr:leucyl/phenylalanyl-tRNA--protein transferase [Bacteriovoracaceae bacterium]